MARIPRKKGIREPRNRHIMVADEKGNYVPARSDRRIFFTKVFLAFVAVLMLLIAFAVYLFVFERSDERKILEQNAADRDVIEMIDRENRAMQSTDPEAQRYQDVEENKIQ